MKYELRQTVTISALGEQGAVIGRTEYANCEPAYLIRYVNTEGRIVESWRFECDLVSGAAPSAEAGAPARTSIPDRIEMLSFDEIENCFPDGACSDRSTGEIRVSAQWLHHFAAQVEAKVLDILAGHFDVEYGGAVLAGDEIAHIIKTRKDAAK